MVVWERLVGTGIGFCIVSKIRQQKCGPALEGCEATSVESILVSPFIFQKGQPVMVFEAFTLSYVLSYRNRCKTYIEDMHFFHEIRHIFLKVQWVDVRERCIFNWLCKKRDLQYNIAG